MKKLTILFLIFALMISVSCKKNSLNPNFTQNGSDSDLITTNGSGSSTNQMDITSLINRYAGVYYGEGYLEEDELNDVENGKAKRILYKLRDGKIYTVDSKSSKLVESTVQAVLPSANKIQISNYTKGIIEVLNLRDDGLDYYINFILEKVSDTADTNGMQSIGIHKSLIAYKGTYKSTYDKKDKFLAIDGIGQVYFCEKVEAGNIFVSKNQKELMIIKDGVRNTMIFEQGVYRKYDLTENSDIDTTAKVCEVTKYFLEDIPIKSGWTVYESYPFNDRLSRKEIIGQQISINPQGYANDSMHSAVSIIGWFGDRKEAAYKDNVGHITILKGKTLHIMGRYNCSFTFSDDWRILTYNEIYSGYNGTYSDMKLNIVK